MLYFGLGVLATLSLEFLIVVIIASNFGGKKK